MKQFISGKVSTFHKEEERQNKDMGERGRRLRAALNRKNAERRVQEKLEDVFQLYR